MAKARAELCGIAEVIRSDAGDAGPVRDLMAGVARAHRGIDVLFLNAGIGRFAPITDLDEAVFDEVLRVNLKWPWLFGTGPRPQPTSSSSRNTQPW